MQQGVVVFFQVKFGSIVLQNNGLPSKAQDKSLMSSFPLSVSCLYLPITQWLSLYLSLSLSIFLSLSIPLYIFISFYHSLTVFCMYCSLPLWLPMSQSIYLSLPFSLVLFISFFHSLTISCMYFSLVVCVSLFPLSSLIDLRLLNFLYSLLCISSVVYSFSRPEYLSTYMLSI